MDDNLMDELIILQRFEPVLYFTRGERFYPMDIDRYLNQASLWVESPSLPPQKLVSQSQLDRHSLGQTRRGDTNAIQYLRFIDPPDLLEMARYSLNEAVQTWLHPGGEAKFRAGRGRLARVGYASRFLDALFTLALFLRGRVPGDTALAAAVAYRQLQTQNEFYTYYGRIHRENGWVVLQYWYFYPFNNWRSGFFGVNDHEADWELVVIYCYEDPQADKSAPEVERLRPEWVAYAAHDEAGADLRRHWDDPEVKKVQSSDGSLHPVVYVGAGSHACYYSSGEYLAEVEMNFLEPVTRRLSRVQSFWRDVLRQGQADRQNEIWRVLRVPFVDYARGDGLTIGPQQSKTWSAAIVNDDTSWAVNYRGLWGWYVHDPIAGENAPAGPVYRRNGEIRLRWSDPIGWAGLDKTPSPDQRGIRLAEQQKRLAEERQMLKEAILHKSLVVQRLGVEVEALGETAHLAQTHMEMSAILEAESDYLEELRKRYDRIRGRCDALDLYTQRIIAGETGPLRAHIRRPLEPASEVNLWLAGLAETFAALSIGLVMVGVVFLILFARQYLLVGLAAMLAVLIFAEAGFRRRLDRLITSLTVSLAIVSALILMFEFFWQIIVVLILVAGFYIMWDNIRELWT